MEAKRKKESNCQTQYDTELFRMSIQVRQMHRCDEESEMEKITSRVEGSNCTKLVNNPAERSDDMVEEEAVTKKQTHSARAQSTKHEGSVEIAAIENEKGNITKLIKMEGSSYSLANINPSERSDEMVDKNMWQRSRIHARRRQSQLLK